MQQHESLIDTMKSVLVPIHPDGVVFVLVFGFVAIILALIYAPLGWIGLLLTLWCAYFFRDPPRMVPQREGLIVSPADGLVQKIVQVVPPAELDMGSEPRTRISIFLNVFDVHIQRVPMGGTVNTLYYHHGKFINASLDKASEDNERQLVKITTTGGKTLGVVQIAGLVARRIVCNLEEQQVVRTGEKYGLIRFGSRVDLYLPEGVNPLVVEGQYAIGGETVFGDLQSNEAQRTGAPL